MIYTSRLHGAFPFGIGIGGSTGCELVCEFCGRVHNKGYDVDRDGKEGESICYITFLGKQMAECCFDALEENIFRRREDIVAWLYQLSKASRDQANRDALVAAKGKNALEILKHSGP